MRTEVPPAAAGDQKIPPDSLSSTPLHSRDDIPALLGLQEPELYPRLALWLVDATPAQIADYWKSYREREPEEPAGDLLGLIFHRWTQIDPQAACAAAEDSGNTTIWIAWAAADPRTATGPEAGRRFANLSSISNLWGEVISSADPQTIRGILVDHPELATPSLIDAIADRLACQDCREGLEFARKNRGENPSAALSRWTRQDPQAAFEWLTSNPYFDPSGLRAAFLENLTAHHPERLAEFAAALPEGSWRRQLEAAAFQQRIAEDPQAALAEARAAASPGLIAERLAEIGRSQAPRDFPAALATLHEILALPAADTEVYRQELNPLTHALIEQDPTATMDAVMAIPHPPEGLFSRLAERWIEADLADFGGWLESQTESSLRDLGSMRYAQEQALRYDFLPAAATIGRISDPALRLRSLTSFLSHWSESGSSAPWKWLEQADLPDEIARPLREQFRQRPETDEANETE